MTRITTGVRLKRFRVKESANLSLVVETQTGDRATFKVQDSSITGLGTIISSDAATAVSLEVGDILPLAKLVWEENEVHLGRIVLRSKRLVDGQVICGFSTIDSRVPLLGALSKHFEVLASGAESALDFELGSQKFNIRTFLDEEHSHSDLFERCRQYELLSKDFYKNPLAQFYAVRHESSGTRVKLSLPRVRKPTEFVTFATYDYFNLSSDPEVKDAAKRAIDKFGVSATATPPLSGRTAIHEEFEQMLARLLRKDDAILFGSGFAANVGSLTSLLRENDLAVADLYSHASIYDGLKASGVKYRLFRHNNVRHLDSLLAEHRSDRAGSLVVTEGLFSMDGDVPDLEKVVEVAKKYEARVFLDEVHSFGIMGEKGLGAAERCGVLDDIDIYTGSLSKGIGAGGGFVASSREVIGWMRSTARSGLFSSAVPPAAVAAAMKALELIQTQPERRKRLIDNIKHLSDGLRRLGLKVTSDAESPIVPVVIGDMEKMGVMNQVLLEHKIFVNTVVFPAVEEKAARFRFSVSVGHSFADIELALVAFRRAMEKAGINPENEVKGAA